MFFPPRCLGIWSAVYLVRVLEPQRQPAGLVRQDPHSQLVTFLALTSLLAFVRPDVVPGAWDPFEVPGAWDPFEGFSGEIPIWWQHKTGLESRGINADSVTGTFLGKLRRNLGAKDGEGWVHYAAYIPSAFLLEA